MYAVGRLGSYISRGVYTVSAPFHPFGGAVDIVVVEQQDESFKSSPWYVRFGKFQGVLKAKEKVVHINVNGVDANFHMHLDHTGEAYFLHEVDAEGDLILLHASSYEEMDELDRRQMKANSRNYGVDPSDLEVSNGKVFNRTGSRRSRILGLAIGRNSVKANKFQDEESSADIVRAESLERAEIAADLLEMNWSTNLASVRKEKNNSPDTLDGVDSKSGAFKRQSTIYYETFDASKLELDDFREQPDETLFVHGILGEGSRCDFVSDEKIHESEITSSKANRVLTEALSEPLLVELIDDSTQEFDSISQVQNERSKEDENEMLQPFFEPSCDQEVSSDLLQTEAIKKTSSIELEEEQFIFGDLDDIKDEDGKCTDLIYPDHMDKEKYTSFTSEGVNSVKNSSHSGFVSPDKFVQENQPNDGEEVREETKVISNEISIPIRSKFAGQEQVGGMAESLPIMWSHFDESDEHFFCGPLGHSLDSNPKSSKWKLLRENLSSCIKADAENVHRLSDSQPTIDDATNLGKLKNVDSSPAVGIPSEIVETSSRSWGIWPFPFKRSSSMKETHPILKITRSLDADISLEGTIGMDGEREVPKPKVYKKKIRAISPTTEQLASLNLKEGRNIVKFTFSTAMLGKQQVDARIYLWRWDTRVVITDVDGTITKSDVLGQFMPLVGKDWSQTGVAHLFSAIKENGYQLLFLSARAISQAGLTRQFLFNLKQDGKALPDGPVVISPDGLFPSLFREVIRRAPHEFKIASLEDIKACFPSDRNPFYAGFGNRDTDEFSYLKVGIPKGKIFIINPKGEVVVNRCNNRSYTSLHALVNGMFPPTSSEQEDFNSWNFWKLPPPLIDI